MTSLRVKELERELASCKARLALAEPLLNALAKYASISLGEYRLHRVIREDKGWENCEWEVWRTDRYNQTYMVTKGTLGKCLQWCL